MKNRFLFTLLLMSTSLLAQKEFKMPVWPDDAPLSNGLSGAEQGWDNFRVTNVSVPELYVYLPEKSNGGAVILCPGGAYALLAMDHEGMDLAPWFNERGYALIVLKYRMPNGNHEIPLADASEAIRIVRRHTDEWDIDPHRVGIMGASAGGHLASTLATHFDADTRPDFQILLYPVVTMQDAFTHAGSRYNLLGADQTPEMIGFYSNERQVTAQTPPAFLILSDDDEAVPSRNSIDYYLALRACKVSCEMHVYPIGGHGWGFLDTFPYKTQWTTALSQWLECTNF